MIPVLPGVDYLGDAVGSALAQEHPADEILVVDAGPVGGPGSVIEAAAIEGVRYLRHDRPDLDPADLWNHAIGASTGEVVILLDPDEVLLASAVGDHLAALDRTPTAEISVGDVIVLGPDLIAVEEAFWGPSSVIGHLACGESLPSAAMAMTRSAWATVGPYRSGLGNGAHGEWMAAATGAVEIAAVGRHTVARRGVGFDELEPRPQVTVLHTLLGDADPATVLDDGSVTDAEAWLEIGLRLLRLGDATGALRCFERAETETPTPAGAEMVETVQRALVAGEMELIEPLPVRTVGAPTDGAAADPAVVPPTVTVAIAAHDQADVLCNALNSALSQTRAADEILVVDAGSSDHTRQVAARYAARGVRYVHQEHRGVALARNRCLSEAVGEWILWLDADVVLVPEAIELHLARLAELPDADVVYGDVEVVDVPGRSARRIGHQDPRGRDGVVASLFDGDLIPHPGTMIRRSVLLGAGGYHPDDEGAHDHQLIGHLAATTDFAHHPHVVAQRLVHDGVDGIGEEDRRLQLAVVHRMLDQHTLLELVPDAGWGVVTPAEADATAHLRVAVRLVALGDVSSGLDHARRAVALVPSAPGRELVSTLEDAVRTHLVPSPDAGRL
ncbi:MAG: glycosyltransferase [Actinomycetota bacterium]